MMLSSFVPILPQNTIIDSARKRDPTELYTHSAFETQKGKLQSLFAALLYRTYYEGSERNVVYLRSKSKLFDTILSEFFYVINETTYSHDGCVTHALRLYIETATPFM